MKRHMTIPEATRILRRVKQLRKYPQWYLLSISFGFGIFAAEGRHSGAGMGYFYPPSELRLYGLWNFRRNGGMAWQLHYKTHERIALRRRVRP